MLHTLLQIMIYAYMAIGVLLAVETGKGNYHKLALEVYLLITVLITLYFYVIYFEPIGKEYT